MGRTRVAFTQSLNNTTDQVQWVEYRIHPYTAGTGAGVNCEDGVLEDSIFKIYVIPTARIDVLVEDDTICDTGTSTITVSSPTTLLEGLVLFDYTIEDVSGLAGDVTGQTEGYGEDLGSFVQTLDNTTDQVQWVEYRIHPYIVSSGTGFDCDHGTGLDSTFRIYVNPTPDIDVVTADSVLCNEGEVMFNISHPNGIVAGEWKYDLQVDYGSVSGDNIGGPKTEAETLLADNLVNTDTIVHRVAYTFKPLIDPENGTLDCGSGYDTTLYIYVNPTPEIRLDAPTAICNEDELVIDVRNPNDTIRGEWKYRLEVDYGIVQGLNVGGDYLASQTQIIDTLTNNDTVFREVIYRFYPRIDPDDDGPDCENGIMDSIVVVVDPTPAIRVVAKDTVICNDTETMIEIFNPNAFFWGDWVYDLDINEPSGISPVILNRLIALPPHLLLTSYITRIL